MVSETKISPEAEVKFIMFKKTSQGIRRADSE